MRYKSTRDSATDFSFEQALCSGYAPDGGLFVPSFLPSITAKEHLIPWSRMTFDEVAFDVLRMFISSDEISSSDLKLICTACFKNGFDTDGLDDPNNPVPVKRMGSIFITELFHGPTYCFKDFGMRPVVYLLSHFATLRNRPTTLLVSTTGDTGPAAVRAVGDVANPLLTILVHYPHGQISEFQRRQLTTVSSDCVKVAAFEGGGDDMDWPIKQTLMLSGGEDNNGRSFCGINSYNIGRPLMQMVHFIWAYLRVAEKLGITPGDEKYKVDVVLPTGAMGNIAGGYMAKQIGVPIGLLCAGVNINDITHRVMEKGEFHKKQIQKTLSEAINIEVPYNFERLLFYLTDGNHSLVKEWMTIMENTHKLTLDEKWLDRLKLEFRSARITDDEMCHALQRAKEEYDYVADPHTAVAMAAAERLCYPIFKKTLSSMSESPGPDTISPMTILATASPCKFQEAVTVALGEEVWKNWEKHNFPRRALKTMTDKEIEPILYRRKENATISEIQSEWRTIMLSIVEDNF